ncbi:hypothetical protein BDU57DRAFT_115101 [Ampelomyces quisqualis]|uniref:Uncharacterized protein n=1 Tax=Ampelomyces quisqualis TaxID=50730 RepID=A0A6A5Q9L8_AMPQU|nr:hypothetical protein BDU57DRAFT_115101 [Ampelomyces quisqualis]
MVPIFHAHPNPCSDLPRQSNSQNAHSNPHLLHGQNRRRKHHARHHVSRAQDARERNRYHSSRKFSCACSTINTTIITLFGSAVALSEYQQRV